ncbi:hypothetical protein [Shewanella woodyi]|uniref:Uncharacterized protein n=1 Tax=Shewanella woodyi (strain ATCC 51908 / MS32) TaxID=392500 RepID=B1KGN5_SHEWM|nr:hypothetical protein [Shewanella woodyi]ACA85363.1 hypothetical protein Swoo_1070 [Shewanella woodyi ATCC 51908]
METWRNLICKANQSFRAGDWKSAESQYLTAMERIDHLYKNYSDNEQILMAWLASYHNLSELYGRLGRVDAQLSHIMQPYHQLKNRLMTQADHEPIYAAILHGINLSCKELYLYQKQQLEISGGVNLKYQQPVFH